MRASQASPLFTARLPVLQIIQKALDRKGGVPFVLQSKPYFSVGRNIKPLTRILYGTRFKISCGRMLILRLLSTMDIIA